MVRVQPGERQCLLGELADPPGSDPGASWFDSRAGSCARVTGTGRPPGLKPSGLRVRLPPRAPTTTSSSGESARLIRGRCEVQILGGRRESWGASRYGGRAFTPVRAGSSPVYGTMSKALWTCLESSSPSQGEGRGFESRWGHAAPGSSPAWTRTPSRKRLRLTPSGVRFSLLPPRLRNSVAESPALNRLVEGSSPSGGTPLTAGSRCRVAR